MKVSIWLLQLQNIVDLVSRFVSKHSTLPVLENIYIKWTQWKLIFRASDMEKFIELEIPARIESEWVVTVNARTFSDIIKSMEDETIIISLDSDSDILHLTWEGDEFSIKWISADEYVAVPEVSDSESIEIDANDFSLWISKVEYAINERNFLPTITWILLKIVSEEDSNKLVFVWADSLRLAEYKLNYVWEYASLSIIIPKVNIWEIKKVTDYFIAKWWEKLYLTFNNNLVSFKYSVSDIIIRTTSMLIQWSFPDYNNEKIIPKDFNTVVKIDKEKLEKNIRKISTLTRDINYFINISINWNVMEMNSWETDKWQGRSVLNIVTEWNDSITLWINWKYLLDFIKSVEAVQLTMSIVDEKKPLKFRSSEEDNYTYVITPLVI